ncbi:MAG: DNA glycosylase [Dehalococcoidia bacterium]
MIESRPGEVSTVDAVFVPAADIDVSATLDGGQAFRWWPEHDGLRGVIGERVLHIRRCESGVLARPMDGRPPEGIAAQVHDYIGAGLDLDALRLRFADDPCIGPAVTGYAGLRLLRQDPWECLVSFICSSTSNIPRIKLNVGSVASALGTRVGPGARDFQFPSPGAIAEAGETRLRELGLGFRAKYLIPAAESVAAGRLDLYALRNASYMEAREALIALAGVGEKIADCVLAFSLDKPEAFPVDRWIKRALQKWYGLPENVSNSAAADWARAHFGEYGAVAQQYMFHRERLAGRAAAWGGDHIAMALPEDMNRGTGGRDVNGNVAD